MGISKNDSPVYLKIDRTFIASNADAVGRLLRCHLKTYWKSGSSDAYKSVFNSLRNFLDFQKSRNEPAREWDLGSVAIFFEHGRTTILEEYDIRLTKHDQKNLEKKTSADAAEISLK